VIGEEVEKLEKDKEKRKGKREDGDSGEEGEMSEEQMMDEGIYLCASSQCRMYKQLLPWQLLLRLRRTVLCT
jgi:hypothetical protein